MRPQRAFVRRWRFWVAVLPWGWLLLFFALPFALIVGVSLSTPELSVAAGYLDGSDEPPLTGARARAT